MNTLQPTATSEVQKVQKEKNLPKRSKRGATKELSTSTQKMPKVSGDPGFMPMEILASVPDTSNIDTTNSTHYKTKIKIGQQEIDVPMSPLKSSGFPSLIWINKVADSLKTIIWNMIAPRISLNDPRSLRTMMLAAEDAVSAEVSEFQDLLRLHHELRLQIEREMQPQNTRSLALMSNTPNENSTSLLKQLFDKIITWFLGNSRATSIEDFRKLFRTIGLPPIADYLKDDRVFAYMMVGGPNPVLFRKASAQDWQALKNKIGVTSEILGDQCGMFLSKNQLYYVDFDAFSSLKSKANLCMPAPIAIFGLQENASFLQPLCIKCSQNPANNDLFTPFQTDEWMMAKTTLMTAYSVHHELISHLGNTHLLLERIAVATFQLEKTHYLRKLLERHLEGTIFINHAATSVLISKGGVVDNLIAADLSDGLNMMKNMICEGYNFKNNMLDTSLGLRHVSATETDGLYYPYRDDAVEYWNAIHAFVSSYLEHFLGGQEEISDNDIIQAWSKMIEKEGMVTGFGEREDGSMKTFAYLARAVTMIIFTASVQHAAVNYPQATMMTYAPQFPFRIVDTPRQDTPPDYLGMLPDIPTANLQLRVGYLLGSVYYNTLDQYPFYGDDEKVSEILLQFKWNLDKIKQQITTRIQNQENNQIEKIFHYSYLLPDKIPQSINI